MDAMQNKQQRAWGIDVLRMLSMFFVVVLHILGNGGVLVCAEPHSAVYWLAWLWEIAAYCAVDCFAIISGFVMAGRKVKAHKLVSLWLQVFFYSVGITQLVAVLKPGVLGKDNMVVSFFPVLTNQYWYFTAYVMLFLFLPLLEPGVAALTKKQHGILLIALLGVATCTRVLEGYVLYENSVFGGEPYFKSGYSFVWLAVLYLLGSFIQKYVKKEKIHIGVAMGGYLGCVSLTWMWKFLMETAFHRPQYSEIWISYLSPTIVGAAIALFLAFWKLEIQNASLQKLVHRMAPLAFSVYLIHTTPAVFAVLMQNAFIRLAGMSAWKMSLYVFLCAAGIYLLCSGIDAIRCRLFGILHIHTLCVHCEEKANRGAEWLVARM